MLSLYYPHSRSKRFLNDARAEVAFVQRARDELSAGDVSGAEKELEKARKEAAAMEALAVRLRDGKRLSGVKITERRIDDAVRKLKALKENKAKPAEAHKAVELAVGAAQHVETDEELRKEQEQKDAKTNIRLLIENALKDLERYEGIPAKDKLFKAKELAEAYRIKITFDEEIELLKEGTNRRYSESHRIQKINETKGKLIGKLALL